MPGAGVTLASRRREPSRERSARMIETIFAKTRLMGRVVGDPRGGWRLPVVRRLILATVLCLIASLAVAVSASADTSFTNTSPITIPSSGNASPYPSEINVGGLTGPITGISVTLHRFVHKFPSEVDILLVSPGGKGVILVSDACSNAGNIEDFTWTFSQSAPGPMSGGCSAFTYRPTNVSDGDGRGHLRPRQLLPGHPHRLGSGRPDHRPQRDHRRHLAPEPRRPRPAPGRAAGPEAPRTALGGHDAGRWLARLAAS